MSAREVVERVEREHGARLRNMAARHAGDHARGEDAYQEALARLWERGPREWPYAVKWVTLVMQREAWLLGERASRALSLDAQVASTGSTLARQEVTLLHLLPDERPVPEDYADSIGYVQERVAALHSIDKPSADDARRALLLVAAGYSYEEITEQTGWSHTRINRLTAEARRDARAALGVAA